MLSAFQLENNRLTRLEAEESQPLIDAVWVDLVEPDDDERLRVQSELGQSLATRPELEDIEASARFFEDEDGLHIHSFFFFEDAEDHAGNSTVAFTIRDGRLFTLRERELPAFRLYRMRARSQAMVDGNAYELLLDLFETKIEQLADEIENIYSDLEKLSRVIMEGHQGDEYDEALSTLAELEDIGWKVRLCLMDTQRALNFLVRKARLPGGQLEQAREILRDIESLLPHNESLFQKVNFLRDLHEHDDLRYDRESGAWQWQVERIRARGMTHNVVTLMLAKFTARAGEIGVRRALGATRSEIFRQSLVEAGVLGAAGAVLGLGLALYGIELVNGRLSGAEDFYAMHPSLMVGTVALGLLAALVAGLLPTWQACQVRPAIQLKSQ